MPALDKWTQWITERRFGGNAEVRERAMEGYYEIRDAVLKEANIQSGEIVVDVGCGDGMLGFKALDSVGENGKVIFVDISADLLNVVRGFIETSGIKSKTELIENSADNLCDIESGSVDVVMTRSVLIYVQDKKKAFEEFYRILKPTGRISIWEPINIFSARMEKGKTFFGYDITPIADLMKKAMIQPGEPPRDERTWENNPMMNFDERDLLNAARDAGFREITLKYEATISHQGQWAWDIIYKAPPNPNAMSLEEMVNARLTPEEKQQFLDYFKPLVETTKSGRVLAIAHVVGAKE